MKTTRSNRLVDILDDNPTDWILDKLMKLKYRMNDAYRERGIDTKKDKTWVMGQISALREGARLDRHQVEYANRLWRKYE
tara:strand:- start:136 stop:375 length:240 start_codon:yes stop_codon:yes gene_type:complete